MGDPVRFPEGKGGAIFIAIVVFALFSVEFLDLWCRGVSACIVYGVWCVYCPMPAVLIRLNENCISF